MKTFRIIVALGAFFLPGLAQAYPFGSLTASANVADLNAAYATWKARRLSAGSCANTLCVIQGGSTVVSEGMGYGMLMAAYLDPDDTSLTKLWNFYSANMDPNGLMNWSVQTSTCSNNGANAATDGDLDVALALLQANKRWPANGWGAKATTLLNNLYSHMTDTCQTLKNGDTWGGCTWGGSQGYNPSYFRMGYLKSFDCYEGGARWSVVRTNSYNKLNTIYTSYALPSDWIQSSGAYGQGSYGYDACRTPWSIGVDYLWFGNATAQNWDVKITDVFRVKAGGTPAAAAADIGDGYDYLSGNKTSGNHENEFMGAIAVAAMGSAYPAFLDAVYTEIKNKDNNTYFSDSLKVVYLMALCGVFTEPACAGGPSPTPSYTDTPSRTRTPTLTISATRTLTATPSTTLTPSPSFTGTKTSTPTFSPSSSPTSSLTRTPSSSATPTMTATSSFTATLSRTPTMTLSSSLTSSPSQTPSSSPSVTSTLTQTGTASPSRTVTPSLTITMSFTPASSPTDTPPFSPTSTFTVTQSSTATRTATVTSTATATPSSTVSLTASPDSTPSDTPNGTLTASPTPSATATLTPSPTSTPSSSASASSTATPSPTLSLTASPSPSATGTLSQSPSTTVTPTATPSNTPNLSASTATSTSTPSPTRTQTAAAAAATSTDDGPPKIVSQLPYPNPNPTGLHFQLQGSADHVELRIYTKAMVCLEILRKDQCSAGWQHFDFSGSRLLGSANGLYYYKLVPFKGTTADLSAGPGLLMLMK